MSQTEPFKLLFKFERQKVSQNIQDNKVNYCIFVILKIFVAVKKLKN